MYNLDTSIEEESKHGPDKMKSWMTGEVFKSIDVFGESLPTFILKGRDKVTTRTGGVATIVITIIALMYALLKFSHLIDKHNPMMSTYFKEDYWKSEDLINLGERNVRLAFTIEDHLDPKKQKNDPKYVKWLVR